MTRRARLPLVIGLALGVAPAARAIPLDIPATATPLTAQPPLTSAFRQTEQVFPGHLASRVRVRVSLDARGRVVRVRAFHRIDVRGKGDYSFAVTAPVTAVAAARGSDSMPGLRRGAILWQGFSPERRALIADAVLSRRAAAMLLPIRVSVVTKRRSGGVETTLVIRNATTLSVPIVVGDVDPKGVAAYLDRLRAALANGRDLPPAQLDARGAPTTQATAATVPLRVEGRLTFPAGARVVAGAGRTPNGRVTSFQATLGQAPLTLHIPATATRKAPRLRLSLTPSPPLRDLTPPDGATWTRFVVTGQAPTGRRLLERTFGIVLAFARYHQYQQFLRNPDPAGTSHTDYVFETAAVARPTAHAASGDGDSDGLRLLLTIVFAAAGTTGLVVLWAHS